MNINTRAHSNDEVSYLERPGVNEAMPGEREIAEAMLRLCADRPAPQAAGLSACQAGKSFR
ncbi:hypothetical protein ACVWZA_002264 [Sphingomonas sp. UYAg733]